MTRKLIALATAAAIATTGFSAPARAGSAEDLARLLVGVAIIGAIANAANDSSANVTVTHGHSRPPVVHHNNPRPPAHAHRAQPPRQCLVRERTRHGWVERYAPRCMARLGWHFERGEWVPNRYVRR